MFLAAPDGKDFPSWLNEPAGLNPGSERLRQVQDSCGIQSDLDLANGRDLPRAHGILHDGHNPRRLDAPEQCSR